MKNLETQVVHTNSDQEVVVRKKSGHKLRAGFSAIGQLSNTTRRKKVMSHDVFDLLDKVSKGAFSVFNNLKFNRDEGNNVTSYVPTADMDKTDRETLSRKLRELKNVGLITSVKKNIPDMDGGVRPYVFREPRATFIIHPDMIRCTNHDEAEYLWGQCAEEKV